ncbi:MAG: CAP domain-containing protein [Candidatus Altimarinota bacterium]
MQCLRSHFRLSPLFLEINRIWIGLLLTILSGALAFQHASQALEPISTDILIHCTNAIREKHGLEKLYPNEQLNQAAQQKLLDMEQHQYWAHQNPSTGKLPWEFIDESGFYYIYAGENLAIGYELSEQICEAWKNSPSHFENMISPDFQEIGFAYQPVTLGEKSGVLVVQMFGTRLGFEKNEALTYDCSNEPTQKVKILHPLCGTTLEQEDTLLIYNPLKSALEITINGQTPGKTLPSGDFTRYIFEQPFSLGSQHVVISDPTSPNQQMEWKFMIAKKEEGPSVSKEFSANLLDSSSRNEAAAVMTIFIILGSSLYWCFERRKTR